MKSIGPNSFALALFFVLFITSLGRAERGADAWLRYAPLAAKAAAQYDSLPATVVVLDDSEALRTAQQELVRGVKGMLGRTLRVGSGVPTEAGIILGKADEIRTVAPNLRASEGLQGDDFWLTSARVQGFQCIIIAGGSDRGALYGVFAFLSKIAREESVSAADLKKDAPEQPSAPVRWANQWDNLDGSIERGYGGRSIFFENGSVRADITRVSEYARLLASVGINGCNVNNVNANLHILDSDFITPLTLNDSAFGPWGVWLVVFV